MSLDSFERSVREIAGIKFKNEALIILNKIKSALEKWNIQNGTSIWAYAHRRDEKCRTIA